jgi:hypothetical protein
MTDKTWERCYREWAWGNETVAEKDAYDAGWRACLSQIIAVLEDEESSAGGPGDERALIEKARQT